jgi:hypothetical protein
MRRGAAFVTAPARIDDALRAPWRKGTQSLGHHSVGHRVFGQPERRPTALAVIRKAIEIREKLENQAMQGDGEKHLLKAETKS